MNILVINGSPKGKYSITLQTVLYLEKCFPEHTFQVLHAGQRIKALQKDFAEVVKDLEEADLILFSYPVYTFIAPSQLHLFIELAKASGVDLSGKFVTQITTSKHFYDVTAHRYIQDNCQDMGMKFIKGLSADMDDLLTVKGQNEAKRFFKYVQWCMKKDSYEPLPKPSKPAARIKVHVPKEAAKSSGKTEAADQTKKTARGKEVVIVTDCRPQDDQLQNMIARFQKVLPLQSRVVNIREYPFIGGCLGCFNCAVSGKCIYTDGFDDFLRNDIQGGAAIIYAFTIQDHSMGSAFKQYDDRQFCNGHRTVTMGMPMGYLVSGDYSKEFNLQMIIEGRAEVGGNFLAGVATDETDPDTAIDRLAKTCVYAIKHRYVQPQNFYGVGGMKIFRDLIYLMQGMMKADHQFYKQHGQYDFPQKKKGTLVKMYLVGALISSPQIKAKMGNKMNEGMLAPYKKVLEKV
ncbi:MAG: NAD(P)H-dependent oxidoreductase [Lachnospiraceae bacterium]|nr:NAD(P)H-dependent oxidoreductase [Lachnospiraceae bacterium]